MPTPEKVDQLIQKKCQPCEGKTDPLSGDAAARYLALVPGWEMNSKVIQRKFRFKNYYETSAFVNAVVWIAHREDHHPDITFGYKECDIVYTTHAIGGLSENDFICAAKINVLLSD